MSVHNIATKTGEPVVVPFTPEEEAVATAAIEAHAIAETGRLLEAVRAKAQKVILAKYPLWYQTNCANGVYPAQAASDMATAIASVITESNRCEDLIEAGQPYTPNWPVL